MIIQFFFLLLIFFACVTQSFSAEKPYLAKQFEQFGYKELHDTHHNSTTFDILYGFFDELIEFLQKNPAWEQKLYIAKERFIRTKEKNHYSTDFFGYYDESKRKGRNQISFYYSVHFHTFIESHYQELLIIEPFVRFLNTCREIQKSYGAIFTQAAAELGLETIFSSKFNEPPILFKVVKYLISYAPQKPHYDGTAFSLFLDSTDNKSLLISAYKPLFAIDDFATPARSFARCNDYNSIILIPGTLLTEFSIYPTAHIVAQSHKTRYATIAFAMRPNYISQKNDFSHLPTF